MPMFLDAALILSTLLLAPIMIPCVMKGPVAAFTEIMAGEGVDMPASVMTHPFVVHVLVIDMGKNFLCIALGLYAALLTSHLPTKKAVALLLACQSSWAMFVAWGFASPKVEDATGRGGDGARAVPVRAIVDGTTRGSVAASEYVYYPT